MPRVTRGAAVLVDSVVAQIEELLAGGASEAEDARKLELKLNTLQKAIRAGRVRMPAKKRARRSAFTSRAAKASAPKWIVRPRWDAVRPRPWNGWRQAWAAE